MKFSMTLPGAGRGTVRIDGQDVAAATTGADIRTRPGEPTQVVLELMLVRTDLDIEDAEVTVPPATRKALLQLGWAPPADEPEGER